MANHPKKPRRRRDRNNFLAYQPETAFGVPGALLEAKTDPVLIQIRDELLKLNAQFEAFARRMASR